MKRLAMAAACVATLAVPANASGVSVEDLFSGFFSFGDSLTDDGKFGVLDPPSLGGRFSNGPTWSEYIEDDFAAAGKDAANFALGGATAGPVNLRNPGPLATFEKQITAFSGLLLGNLLDPGTNPLVSVWLGANDIFQGFSPIDAADSVANGVRAIASIAGESFDDFLINKLPDIGASPGFAGAGSAAATAATTAFNMRLMDNVTSLRSEGLNIITYDPQAAFDVILADVANGSPIYGITNITDGCTQDMGAYLDPNFSNFSLCADPDAYLFADSVHPGATAHRVLSEQVRATIIASVPLPATLPLMISVLGVAGFALRRRKAA